MYTFGNCYEIDVESKKDLEGESKRERKCKEIEKERQQGRERGTEKEHTYEVDEKNAWRE